MLPTIEQILTASINQVPTIRDILHSVEVVVRPNPAFPASPISAANTSFNFTTETTKEIL